MPRPSPERLKALKADIARRYRTRQRYKASLAALRIRDLQRIMLARYRSHPIADDKPGRDLITIMAHHLAALPADPRRTITSFLADHAPWFTIAEQQALILETISKPQRWRADTLAWRLRLIDEDRTALRITTIGAIDVSKAMRATRRRKRQNENCRKWRAMKKAQQ